MQDGWTPFPRASVSGHHETVEVLLAHKADVNAKSKVKRGEGCEAYKLMTLADRLQDGVEGILTTGDERNEFHCRGQKKKVDPATCLLRPRNRKRSRVHFSLLRFKIYERMYTLESY